ncbi:hypothetical protein SAMN05216490_2721 [Mucilaginibacter mallensis]|uniref:Outer membrane protein beta-barrel domain-containing protein n=1 Tax=Mucilaginibacter mallensis TaxID=652787 RepID=A0A1H1YF78_MUCMA|nr:autotransporter outer membrane beta-barrel domain-containing protein [Mucilaginibacter mallensis]SDT20110.1 hypothetical protein SAMN05216490_2721 [Mucilaginibacter mallensis]
MKKLMILIAAFLFAMQISKAQTEKGDQNLGVNLGYTLQKSNTFNINPGDNTSSTVNNKYNSFSAGPDYSYFIADKLDIGASLSYTTASVNNMDGADISTQSSKSYSATIFIRKYFMYHDKIGFRMGPQIGYFGGTQKQTYSQQPAPYNENTTSNGYTAGFNLDFVYYPAKNIGLSATIANLEYAHTKDNNHSLGHGDSDNLNLDFINNGLNLSVFYVFGNK